MEPARELYRVMLDRAIDRGEIPTGSDVDLMMDMLYGAAYHRLLQGHRDIDATFLAGVAHMIAAGARAGAAVVPSSTPATRDPR